jgi:hypothetical protein
MAVSAEGLRSEIRAVDENGDRRFDDLKRHFEVTAEGLRSDVAVTAEGLRSNMAVTAEGLRNEIRAVDENGDRRFDDLKRHFDVVGESLRSDIRLAAEGVAGLDEKFTQEFVKVREEIGDVKSLLRASYGDLDRRVQALERKPS